MIHPTAIVDPKAEIGEEVEIGPYTIIEKGVLIGSRTKIGPHVVIREGTQMGKGNQIYRSGYRLGLYSNATDDPLIQRLVNQNGLRPWLSPTFSSAGWGWRKPQAEPSELIARRWGLPPEEIVMVGDTLNADILGAQNAGMYSILVTMDEASSNETNRHIHPQATAASLAALPEIVAGLGGSEL